MRKSYLDGLRGWASLFVLFSHLGPMLLWAHHRPPFLPFITDGQFAIYIFFVLSGFVLSIGFYESGSRRLVFGLLLRRYPRLTIPILASSGLAFFLMSVGAFANREAGSNLQNEWLASFYAFEPSLHSLLSFSLWDVYVDYPAENTYNAVLWTMAYEMLGSIMVFAILLIAGKGRLAALAMAIVGAILWQANHPLFAFLLGMLIAWFSANESMMKVSSNGFTKVGAWLLLILALLCAMFRQDVGFQPRMLSLMAAAVLISVIALPVLRAFFSSRVSKFLGRISFPLYLTHLLVICSWSSWLLLWTSAGAMSGVLGSVIVGITTLAIALAVAFCFSPVEKLSVHVGQLMSDFVMNALGYQSKTRYQKPA